MNIYFKELLILAYVLKSYSLFLESISDRFLSTKILYVGMFLMLFIGLVMASYIRGNVLRFLFGLTLFLAAAFHDAYESITSDPLSYNTFITLMNSQGFAGEALQQYFSPIATAGAGGLLLLIGISLKPRRTPPLSNKVFILFPCFLLLLLTAMYFIRGDGREGELPSPFTPLAYLILATYEGSYDIEGRQEVQIDRINKEIKHDIIFLIDESITATYLDLNSKYGMSSGLNNTYKDKTIYNYGYAASITNCSWNTNMTLRYGGTRDNYLNYNATMPSIWEYAKKANLHTVYIDAQETGNKLQNGMTDKELKDIDEFIQYDEIPVLNRDMAIAKTLVQFLNNDKHDFIIANKIGAHFPIHDKYPDQFIKYKPALPRGNSKFFNIAHTGSKDGFHGGANEWLLYKNSYKNTLLWNVDEFFSRLFQGIKSNNWIIIYTSDHGQDLHERGNPGLATHCSSDPELEEGLVPLVVIEGSGLKTLNWKTHLTDNFNKSSHYNIFPTLLSLMHYDKDKIKSVYGNSLHEETDDDFTFNTNFHARLGKQPTWTKIDLNEIYTLSAND